MHRVRHRRIAAVVRELWETRDQIAPDRDISPGRVLPDAVLVEVAMEAPTETGALPGGHRAVRRYQRQWIEAITRGQRDPRGQTCPR